MKLREVLEEELALVEAYIAFLDCSRTRGGLLYIPEEMSFPVEEGEPSFEEELLEALMQPLPENYEPSAFLGFIVRGPAEFSDKIRHIEFDGEFRKVLCARAYDIKGRIELLDKD